MPADPNRVKDLFLAAAELPAAERRAFLAGACGGDTEVVAAVERLLAAHDAPDRRIDRPADDPGATSADGAGPAAGDRPADDRGLVLAGRYKLVERIGEGGMGSVWMAQQVEPVKRAVAVKLIKAGMDSQAVLARFEAERQALALMDHPNIAKVLDAGLTADRRPFFVMELVKGVPITQFCDARKHTPRERLALFVPVCQAIQHAHQKGVIHRDIKPSNVLVALYDDRPVPKVIDFGVVKATGQPLTDRTLMTGFGAVVGTPEYMSPEQAGFNQLDVDTRSDVYALGVLLYELLTGSPPHPRKELETAGLLEVLRVIREVEPPRPSARLSTSETLASLAAVRGTEPARLTRLVRGELDWIVMKALEKDRARRYETANGFAAEVQRYLAGEPVQAVPASAGYRLRKFVRRHRAGVTTAAAFTLLLLAGVTVSAWQAVVATQARNDANNEREAADTARGAEADAREKAEAALADSREKTARMTYERAQGLCEEGKADLGLLWMARGLELTPPTATKLDRAIRISLNMWAGQHTTIRPISVKFESPTPINNCAVAVSPDGSSLLTVDSKGFARLWDLSTGKLRFLLPFESGAAPAKDDGGWKCCAAFSPDGRFVAASREDHKARVWNAATGQLVGQPLPHGDLVRGLCFDPAGKLLATVAGKTIRFWSAERGLPDGEPLDPGQDLGGVDFSGDGRQLLSWSRDRAYIWELPSRKLRAPFSGVDFAVEAACFSPDGRLVLATGQRTGDDPASVPVAQFWDVASGQPVGARMSRKPSAVDSGFGRPSFRADGRVAVTGGFPFQLWQVPSGKALGTVNQLELAGSWSPVFRQGGTVLFSFSNEVTMRGIMDVAPSLEPSHHFPIPTKDLLAFDAGPDGRSIVTTHSGPRDGALERWTFRLFDLASGRAVGVPIEAELPAIAPPKPAFSPDGRVVATAVGKNAAQMWDTATGLGRATRLVMDSPVQALTFSPDGRVLAGGGEAGDVRFWDAATGQPVGRPMTNRRPVNRLAYSPDGRRVLVAGGSLGRADGEARLWDVATGEPLGPPLDLIGPAYDAAFSPDGTTFATASFQLILWDAATSRRLWEAPVYNRIPRMAFSPDGRQILAWVPEERAARLFDARTGTPTSPPLRRNADVSDTTFSPDGRLVLTCSYSHSAQLWDAATGLPVGPSWASFSGPARQAGFAPDGRGLLMCEDGVMSRWEIPALLEGTPERIRLAVEAATWFSLDGYGAAQQLDPQPAPNAETWGKWGPDPYEPVRKRLAELGGPPGYFRR